MGSREFARNMFLTILGPPHVAFYQHLSTDVDRKQHPSWHSLQPIRFPTVEEHALRYAALLRYYQRYLNDGDTPRFIATVAQQYTLGTLERLVCSGSIDLRRAAVLTLGLLGDVPCLGLLGPLLKHRDRKLRLIADDAVRAISGREGGITQRNQLEILIRSNECGTFERSVDLATGLIDGKFGTAEVFHQRSLALFQLDSLEHAIQDCRQVLELNPFHYGAMVGLGHCHLELGDLLEALFWFRRALATFPDLEPVRIQVKRLEKAIQEL